MAQSIPLTGTSYFVDFTGGQGAGAGAYALYAQDMDTNFTLLRTVVNQLVAEIGALQGPNASLVLDILSHNNPAESVTTDGVIGEHSYLCTIGSPTSEVDVQNGEAIILSEKVSFTGGPASIECAAILGGSPTTGYVALSAVGEPSVETTPAQQTMDIYSITWNGTAITALTRMTDPSGGEGPIFLDGDAWYRMQKRVASLSFGAYEYPTPADRFEAIERLLSGYNTDLLGQSVGPIRLDDGAVGAPSLIMTDGAGVDDETTGWYRTSANQWAFALSGVQALLLAGNGVSIPGAFRMGIGAGASGTASELLTLSRADPADIVLKDTGDSLDVRLRASGILATLFTNSAHSLQLGYGGASGTAIRAVLSSAGFTLHDDAGTAVVSSTAADTVKVGVTGGDLGFFAAAPTARPTITTARDDPEAALKDLLQALEDLGLIDDQSTTS